MKWNTEGVRVSARELIRALARPLHVFVIGHRRHVCLNRSPSDILCKPVQFNARILFKVHTPNRKQRMYCEWGLHFCYRFLRGLKRNARMGSQRRAIRDPQGLTPNTIWRNWKMLYKQTVWKRFCKIVHVKPSKARTRHNVHGTTVWVVNSYNLRFARNAMAAGAQVVGGLTMFHYGLMYE